MTNRTLDPKVVAAAREAVASWPPMTPAQIDHVVAVLRASAQESI